MVYGDTDSVFVSLAGRTKDEAFRIGEEIANAVTASNPAPIKLKFEKVELIFNIHPGFESIRFIFHAF